MYMLGLMSDQQLSISSLIEHSGKYHGETEIVDCNSNSKVLRTNYKNTLTRVKKLASSLIKLNVKRGDRVGTLAWSNLSHLELYYSISGIGAVCHTINPRLFEEQIVFIINDARNKLLFVAPDFLNLIESIIDRLTSVETIIVLGNKEDISLEKNNSKKIIAYEDLLQHQSTLDTWPSFPETTTSSLC